MRGVAENTIPDFTSFNPGYLLVAGGLAMALDTDRIDEAVLALLYLGRHDEYRAWKGFDWDAMNRLHEKGMIDNPVGKTKSVVFTADGLSRSKELFEKMFTK
jgi:hypothetical protein